MNKIDTSTYYFLHLQKVFIEEECDTTVLPSDNKTVGSQASGEEGVSIVDNAYNGAYAWAL